jgi:crotonobetainyl-CoA:carnitine CoA-transferase CaiB-like acyl-CoA transferase
MAGEPPLSCRVLSLARGVAGAYAVRLLADLGARCSQLRWHAERPGDWPADDLFRRYFAEGVEVVSQPFTQEDLVRRLPALVAHFDLVVTDFTAPEMPTGRLHEMLRPFNPTVVVANADHFGRCGPYADWAGDELTDYALGGYWALGGDPAREPLRVPGYQAQFHAGMHLALAALAALHHARRTGEGEEVEVSAAEAMLGAHWSTTIAWTHEGRVLKRTGSDLVAAADGWVFFYGLGLYQNLFLLIERPDLLDDPRFATIAGWRANGEELWALVADWCRTRPAAEIVATAQDLRIPVTPMADAAQLLADPQLAERGYFRERGGARYPGLPYRWSDTWPAQPPTQQLAGALGTCTTPPVVAAAPVLTSRPVGAADGPLRGLRVVEVTNNWAGPIAGRHLGDLGAEVIKVELATKPATRASHYPGKEPGKDHWNRSGYFNEMNRNKRDLALDLSTEGGREIFLDLIRRSDVLVENNSARVMPNLKLGYDVLAAVNPGLVMASISGFGATGPHQHWVAFGSNIEAACGLAAMTGYDDSLPFRTGSFVPDPIAGGHAVVGILAALARRERTGRGAHLDIALTESAIPYMLQSLTYFQEHGQPFPRRGNVDPEHAPTGAFRCAGEDNWVAIAARSDEQWRALCGVVGLDAQRHPDAATQVAAREEIDRCLSLWTSARDQYECARALQAVGVPAAPILHNWQLHSDPHLFARDAFVFIEHPDTGVLPYPGFPWHFTRTRPSVRMAAPRFAEGNDYVLRTLLGRDAASVEALERDGVIARTPVMPAPVVV